MNSLIEVLGEIAAGERIALVLLSVMALLAMELDAPVMQPHREYLQWLLSRPLHRRAWRLIAWAAIAFSPFHAAWLLGSPAPRLLVRTGDALASGFACLSLIVLLAALGTERGMSAARVRRGTWANLVVTLVLIGCACQIR